MEEKKTISFNVRPSDRKKMIQSFLAMTVGNFEIAQKELIVDVSDHILKDDPQIAMDRAKTLLEHIDEYRDALNDIHELVAEHMFVDTKKTHIKFKAGEKMKVEEFNAAIKEQQAKDEVLKEEIKQKAAQKKTATKKSTAKKAEAPKAEAAEKETPETQEE
jgi:septum formation topological specificity factor MinE